MHDVSDRPQHTVADLVVDALRRVGVDTLFCLPGVQNDDFFDVLFDAHDIRPIVTRHEQGAAYMATGAAIATGRPSAVLRRARARDAQRGRRLDDRLLEQRPCPRRHRRDPVDARASRVGRAARAPRPDGDPVAAHQAGRARRRSDAGRRPGSALDRRVSCRDGRVRSPSRWRPTAGRRPPSPCSSAPSPLGRPWTPVPIERARCAARRRRASTDRRRRRGAGRGRCGRRRWRRCCRRR